MLQLETKENYINKKKQNNFASIALINKNLPLHNIIFKVQFRIFPSFNLGIQKIIIQLYKNSFPRKKTWNFIVSGGKFFIIIIYSNFRGGLIIIYTNVVLSTFFDAEFSSMLHKYVEIASLIFLICKQKHFYRYMFIDIIIWFIFSMINKNNVNQ